LRVEDCHESLDLWSLLEDILGFWLIFELNDTVFELEVGVLAQVEVMKDG
jgi:hypothetical protein